MDYGQVLVLLVVGMIFGAIPPMAFLRQARQRVRKLENLITFHASGESMVQREADKIRSGRG